MSANCCSVPVAPCSVSGVLWTMIMKRMAVSSCGRCTVVGPCSPLRRTRRTLLDTTPENPSATTSHRGAREGVCRRAGSALGRALEEESELLEEADLRRGRAPVVDADPAVLRHPGQEVGDEVVDDLPAHAVGEHDERLVPALGSEGRRVET